MNRLILVLLLAITVSGCATTGGINLVDKNASLHKVNNTGSVFFKLDCEGETLCVVYLHLIPDTNNPDEKPIKFRLREKGTFNGNCKFDPTYYLLDMPAGKWKIQGISDDLSAMTSMYGLGGFFVSKLYSHGEFGKVDVHFEVIPNDITYLGTVKFALQDKKIEFSGILDEEQEATAELTNNYPKIHEPMHKGLAQVEQVNGK